MGHRARWRGRSEPCRWIDWDAQEAEERRVKKGVGDVQGVEWDFDLLPSACTRLPCAFGYSIMSSCYIMFLFKLWQATTFCREVISCALSALWELCIEPFGGLIGVFEIFGSMVTGHSGLIRYVNSEMQVFPHANFANPTQFPWWDAPKSRQEGYSHLYLRQALTFLGPHLKLLGVMINRSARALLSCHARSASAAPGSSLSSGPKQPILIIPQASSPW